MMLHTQIRKWLADHPLNENTELDVFGVPESLFELTDSEEPMKELNRRIKGLPVQQQKLLLYLSRDIDPALIIESMEYPSPEIFWSDKALLTRAIDPAARREEVLRVFTVNESLLEEIYAVSDIMDAEAEKSKKRKTRNRSLIGAAVILILVYFFLYPLLIKPDPVALYEQFKGTYRPDTVSVDTADYDGGSFNEAILFMDEGSFAEAARLFAELIPADNAYRVSSRWFLALINLRSGDRESCREQLKAIQVDDPVFYKKVAEKLLRKL